MRQGDIYNSRDPRFQPSDKAIEVKADVIQVECYDDQGELVTSKIVAFDYFDTGDGLDVRVCNAGIFREDAKEAIGQHLKTRVSSWDFVD